MKKVLYLCLSLSTVASAGDYFPLAKGNVWNYSYESRSSVVYPHAPTTHDSGNVTWETLNGLGNSVFMLYYIKETRSCTRRISYNDTQTFYDSIFSPPRVTVDTIVFRQGVVLTDTGRIADSTKNAISFSGADCPVTIHDPQKPLPVELGIKDTVVQFNGSTLSCKKTIPTKCSCWELNAWSFVLADSVGPVDVSISRCPGFEGYGFFETRRLLQHKYPTAIKPAHPDNLPGKQINVFFRSNRIFCETPGGISHKVSVCVFTASGRTTGDFSGTSPGTISLNIGLVPQGIYLVRVKTETGSVSKKIYVPK